MTRRTKWTIAAVTIFNIAYFLLLNYAIRAYYDTPSFINNLIYHSRDMENMWQRATEWHGMEEPWELTIKLAVAAVATFAVNFWGILELLLGKEKKPTLPISRDAATIICVITGLVSFICILLIQSRFANTYPRVWMTLASVMIFPLIFTVLSVYGLYKLRQNVPPDEP